MEGTLVGLESLESVFSGDDRWGDEDEAREVDVDVDSMEDREEEEEENEGEVVDEEAPLLVALLGGDGEMDDIVEEEGVDGEEEQEGVEEEEQEEEEVEEEATKEEGYEEEDEDREGLEEDNKDEDAVRARGDDDAAADLVEGAVEVGAAVVIGEEDDEEAFALLLRMEKLRKGDCFLDTTEVSIQEERWGWGSGKQLRKSEEKNEMDGEQRERKVKERRDV